MLGLDIFQLAVFTIAVIITGISKSGFAGGLGMISVPLLLLVMNPFLAVSLMLPTLIVMDVMSVRAWWGHQDKKILRRIIPAGIVGVGIGYLTFTFINESQVKIILGLLCLIFGLNGLLGNKILSFTSNAAATVLGTIAGFTSFVAHAGGPPLNFYLLSKSLTKEKYLGSAALFFAFINLAKVLPYYFLGQFTNQNILLALIFIPISFLGVKFGIKIQGCINERIFFKIIYVSLVFLGLFLTFIGSTL